LTSRDFCFWLQGFFEVGLAPDQPLTLAQIDIVRRHLNLVFAHEIDPAMGPPAKQEELTKIHSVVPSLGRQNLDSVLNDSTPQTR
jgi:hypothetical protein